MKTQIQNARSTFHKTKVVFTRNAVSKNLKLLLLRRNIFSNHNWKKWITIFVFNMYQAHIKKYRVSIYSEND